MLIEIRLRHFLTEPCSPDLPPAAALTDYTIDPVYNCDIVVEYRSGMKTTKPYTTNARKQVIQAGQVSLGWDPNVNMVTKSNGYTFRYDFQNRQRDGVTPGGANVLMLYDPFHLRLMESYKSQLENDYSREMLESEDTSLNPEYHLTGGFLPNIHEQAELSWQDSTRLSEKAQKIRLNMCKNAIPEGKIYFAKTEYQSFYGIINKWSNK